MDNRRLIWVIEGVLIVAVVIAVVLFASPSAWAPHTNLGGQSSAAPTTGAQKISFPADVPLPVAAGAGGAGAVQGMVSQLPNGQVRINNSFLSASTTAAVFNFYRQFFSTSAGWTLVAQVAAAHDPAHRAILARNAGGMLTMNITARSSSTALVEMMFVSNP